MFWIPAGELDLKAYRKIRFNNLAKIPRVACEADGWSKKHKPADSWLLRSFFDTARTRPIHQGYN